MEDKSITYNLYSTERRYRKNTLISYYFKPNKTIIKKSSPIDINGERLKLDKITGEIRNYKRKEMENSLKISLDRTTILMNTLLAMNDFDWFWTLTFDKDKIDRTNADAVYNCYKKYINNLSKKFPDIRYMTFPERHEDNCFHFHILVAGITAKQMGLVNSGKVCCHWATNKNGVASKEFYERTKDKYPNKDTDGEPIYNLTTFAYGYTTVSRIVSRERCNTYVKKYVEKALGSTDTFKKRFFYSSNLNLPEKVKKLIGANYDRIHDLDSLEVIKKSPIIQNSKYQYLSEHNVLQITIDNELKDTINKGLIPLSNEDMIRLKLGEMFWWEKNIGP